MFFDPLPIRGKMAANDGSVSVAERFTLYLLSGRVTQWRLLLWFCGLTDVFVNTPFSISSVTYSVAY